MTTGAGNSSPLHASLAGFWNRPALLALLVLGTAIPLLLPPIPPLLDLPGHIARYHVELALSDSPTLQRFYDFHWGLIGNLGVDLLMVPMAKLFGLELGAKLIVIAIPMLLASGLLWTAKELHGRIPPTALFALPLSYHFAFQLGFVNFSLSAALCFLAFALWLRLGRAGRIGLRTLIFAPLAVLVWTAHIYGWGMLGVLAFSAEVMRIRGRGAGWFKSAGLGAVHCLTLCLPFVLMVVWRSGDVRGYTGDWQWVQKGVWLASILRERWLIWDVAGAALLWLLVLAGLSGLGLRMHPVARIAVPILALLFVAMPRVVIGSGYADARLAGFVAATGLIGLSADHGFARRFPTAIATVALLFFGVRIAVTTAAFDAISRKWESQLAALPSIEPGSRVLLLANLPCLTAWSSDRVDHIGSLAVARRDIFANNQWALAGAQLLEVKYFAGAPFVTDPSHMLRPAQCGDGRARLRLAIQVAPRAFDYLWLIDAPPGQWPRDPRLKPVWHGTTGVLYRTQPAREK